MMNEPRTLDILEILIAKEYAWRITELSNFRSSVLQAKGKAKDGMIRAGISLLYAHWEGFIKKSSDLYYKFVSFQSTTVADLNNCFVSIILRSEIESLQNTKKLTIHNNIINTFFNKQNIKANFSSTSPIRTSNLKYDVFEDVCLMIGISIRTFHDRYKQSYDRDLQKTIDYDLVEKRNYIAHGEYLPITELEYKELYDIIVNGILYTFKEMVIDSAQNKQYLRLDA